MCVMSDLRYFQGRMDASLLGSLQAVLEAPFARVTYTEAMALLEAAPKRTRFEFKPSWEAGLQSEHEKYLAETVFKRSQPIIQRPTKRCRAAAVHARKKGSCWFSDVERVMLLLVMCVAARSMFRPVFITNYPRASKPFYMRADEASLATPGRETVSGMGCARGRWVRCVCTPDRRAVPHLGSFVPRCRSFSFLLLCCRSDASTSSFLAWAS